jgi:hypothetical protein
MGFLDGLFKFLWFMTYIAPFVCIGIGVLIGWLIWG